MDARLPRRLSHSPLCAIAQLLEEIRKLSSTADASRASAQQNADERDALLRRAKAAQDTAEKEQRERQQWRGRAEAAELQLRALEKVRVVVLSSVLWPLGWWWLVLVGHLRSRHWVCRVAAGIRLVTMSRHCTALQEHTTLQRALDKKTQEGAAVETRLHRCATRSRPVERLSLLMRAHCARVPAVRLRMSTD